MGQPSKIDAIVSRQLGLSGHLPHLLAAGPAFAVLQILWFIIEHHLDFFALVVTLFRGCGHMLQSVRVPAQACVRLNRHSSTAPFHARRFIGFRWRER